MIDLRDLLIGEAAGPLARLQLARRGSIASD
jgi:hypothetical protein